MILSEYKQVLQTGSKSITEMGITHDNTYLKQTKKNNRFSLILSNSSFTYFMDPLLSVLIGTIFGTDINGSFIMKCKDYGDPQCHHEANIGGYV